MTQVRGKFKVTKITRTADNPSAAEIVLDVRYTNNPEDNTFALYTPSGSITMYVTNPAAIETLALGKSFYVDFTAVEDLRSNG